MSLQIIIGLVAFLGMTGFARIARASTPAEIMTFGAQTFYQDASPTQYILCLTVGGTFEAGAQVYSDYCTGSASQLFSYDGTYVTMTQGGTTLWMTAATDGSKVTMETDQGNGYQVWGTSGSNLENGDCLDVQYGSTSSGTILDVATCNGTEAQWMWNNAGPHNPESIYIEAYSTTGPAYCVAEDVSPATGYELEECCSNASCTTAQKQAQLFSLTENQNIQNVHSSKFMTMNGSGQLVQATSGDLNWTIGQQWGTASGANHSYAFFVNQVTYSGNIMCLDVYDDDVTVGTTVDVSSYACLNNSYNSGYGNTAQFWQLIDGT
jgi:hypothetical protein